MKIRKQRQSPILSYSLSPNKTLRTAESLADIQAQRLETSSNERYVAINDDEVITLIEHKNYLQASLILSQLAEEIESDYTISDEITKSFNLYVCFFNLGVVNWRLKRFHETEKYLDHAMDYLQMNLSFCKYKEQHLVFSLQLIKLMLQQSVVLSQNGKHCKAAEISDKAVNRLFQCFRIKMAMVREILMELKNQKKNKFKNRVDFKKVVLNEAKEKLKFLCQFENSYRMIDNSKEQLQQTINNLYTWKNNLQNNEKFIKMSLKIEKNTSQQQRNILGISKAPDWIQYFNIGSIMTLQPLKMQYVPNLDTFYLLSNNKILELILYTSVSYFTVATEIRFKQLQDDCKWLSPNQKYIKMNDNPKILKCKILHLKAIELVARFMPNSNLYVSHLISSFNKNYKFYMDKIEQQSSLTVENLNSSLRAPEKLKLHRKKKENRKLSNTKGPRINSLMKSGSLEHFTKTKTKIAQISIQELKCSLTLGKQKRRKTKI